MNSIIDTQPLVEMPSYQAPTITTFSAEELLQIIGPALAGPSSMDDMAPMQGSNDLHKILKVV